MEQPPAPPPGPTTITDLGEDLLREIFLRLPDLPSLVRAAFACRVFRRAVRSSPAFRRSFRELHAPPVPAFFLEPNMEVVPVLPSRSRRSDPGLHAADFFGIRLSRDDDPRATGWEIQSWNPSADGYLILGVSGISGRVASYSPLTQALGLSIHDPYTNFEFYTISSEDGQEPSRVVCIRHERRSESSTALVFSSDTMQWQLPRKATLRLPEPGRIVTTMVVRGLVCWRDWLDYQIVLFDTAACQFSIIDLPTPLQTDSDATYKLGETKDDKFCIVDIQDNTLVSWFMTTDDVDERWMMYTKLSLRPVVKEFAGCSIDEKGCHVRVDLVAVIQGFVYMSIFYYKDRRYPFEVYLSLCLETLEISELFKGAYRRNEEAHPYVMPWPLSLAHSKEESDAGSTGYSVAGDRPVFTKEAPTLLVTAVQSLRQALMNDGDSNRGVVAELDAFLGHSLISKMNTLDAQLRTARDCILRIRA